jgi:hypothetical protein
LFLIFFWWVEISASEVYGTAVGVLAFILLLGALEIYYYIDTHKGLPGDHYRRRISVMRVLLGFSSLLTLLGIAHMPYGYYMLLRTVVCLTASWGLANALKPRRQGWLWAYGTLALLYNPVLPVHLGSKSLWVFVNFATMAILWIGASRLASSRLTGEQPIAPPIVVGLITENEEIDKKRLELEGLEGEVAEGELRLATLRADLASLERRYLKIVGSKYAELDELKARIAGLLAREHPGDPNLQVAARRAREQAHESQVAAAGLGFTDDRPTPSQELKSLYRVVAKRVHPDFSTDPQDRKVRERLMAEANEAYELGDLERLRRILQEYEISPESVIGDGTGAELERLIRRTMQVKRRMEEIEEEIRRLNDSALGKLKMKNTVYESQGRDLFAEMAQQIQIQIDTLTQQLCEVERKQ